MLSSWSLTIKRGQTLGKWSICTESIISKLGVINVSVFLFHLVYFSVQVTAWWWSESSRGLIGTEDICIGFIGIVPPIGHQHITIYNHFFLPGKMAQFHRHCCWLLYFEFFYDSSPWMTATTCWDFWSHWKYLSKRSYYCHTDIMIADFILITFLSNLTLLFIFFITYYKKRTNIG